MTPQQKIAAILVVLGEDLAAEILKGLPEVQRRRVLRALSSLPALEEAEVQALCQDMIECLRDSGGTRSRSVDQASAQRVLAAARSVLGDASVWTDAAEDSVFVEEIRDIMEDIPNQVLARYLSAERPSVVALCLGVMPPAQSAAVFALFPSARHEEVILAMAGAKGADTRALEALRDDVKALRSRQGGTGLHPALAVGGVEKVARLLQGSSAVLQATLLKGLHERDPALAEELERRVLSLERVSTLLPADLARVCQGLSDRDLAFALRGLAHDIQNRFFAALSVNRRQCVSETLEALTRGPVRKSDVEGAQALLCQRVVTLREQGLILFPWEDTLVS